jgi:hypothetical protein
MRNRNEIPVTCIILASGSEKVMRFRQYDNDVTELMGNGLCQSYNRIRSRQLQNERSF